MSGTFDARVTPARADLAAAYLKGKVAAEKFAEGRVLRVVRATADLKRAPSADAGLETQLLHGEAFTVYEEKNGWLWGQAAFDSYVGYARSDAFAPAAAPPTHRVSALATPLLSATDVKRPASAMLPMNAKLAIVEETQDFARVAGGYVFRGHIAPIEARAPDWVAVAERFTGVPYLWGGKTCAGIDCSGLVQNALEAGGIAAPRDTDMMENALGAALPSGAELKRGDLIFWKGHMGAMLDSARLIHANGHFMEVTIEPLAQARARIEAAEACAIRTIKRL